jgi:murein DD-endopeptidase MepM/ murein hydrolase activator NlpD
MEEKTNENKKRFKFKNKKIRVAGAIYIALAICVVTVMVLSIYSINTDFGDYSSDFSFSLPDMSVYESEPEDTSQLPVDNEESGIPTNTDPTYVLPVDGEIIKGYAVTSLLYSKTMKDYRTHSGVDIAGNVGDTVKCYSDGYITAIWDDPFMGKSVEVSHGYGLKSVYQNLSNQLPETIFLGAEVKTGDIIGAIGETAAVEGADDPHLHFELLLDGETIDCGKELQTLTETQ